MAYRRAPGRRSVRRGTDWARKTAASFIIVPAATKVLLGSFSLANPGITETVIRTRGGIAIGSDQAAAEEQQLGAFGLVIVSDIAIAAGAASIPGPVTDRNDDGWFVWQPFARIGSDVATQPSTDWYEFDSKAARRLEQGFSIGIMCENAHATHGLVIGSEFSILSKVNT